LVTAQFGIQVGTKEEIAFLLALFGQPCEPDRSAEAEIIARLTAGHVSGPAEAGNVPERLAPADRSGRSACNSARRTRHQRLSRPSPPAAPAAAACAACRRMRGISAVTRPAASIRH
jgi:hypothetical protein